MTKNHIFILLCFILAIQTIASTTPCSIGEVKCSTGLCDSVNYIEGCLLYKSKTQCDTCQYNYVKKNGMCQFQPTSGSKCCLQFDFNGECKKCAPGLYLNPTDKDCIDIKIPGCLEKSGNICINCAKHYQLINGSCTLKISGCIQYTKSTSDYICSKCDTGFELSKGQCVPSTTKPQQILNCKITFEYGCAQCNDGYDLTKTGQCIAKRIPGCLDYASQTQCKVCEDNLYLFYKGMCFPLGCIEMNPNFQCVTCNTKLGFVLQQGVCVIPYCYFAGRNGCNICQQGRVWYRNQCILQSQLDTTVCIACPATYFLNGNNQCQIKEQGCVEYKQNICVACDSSYVFDTVSKKCVRRFPGCNYNERAQCVSCQPMYVYNQVQQKCFIIGCNRYSQTGRCSQCIPPFKLTLDGFCSIENCAEINEKGCNRCIDNYQVNKDGACSPYDPNCIARNIYENCIGCKQGFYVDKTSRCKVSSLGCNYVDGLCTSCKTPFVYNKDTATCFIDGCKKYFFGGCQTCQDGYELRYNSCKLPHCLVSNNGKCLQCDPDYIMRTKTNTCINKDEFCYQYNPQGQCIECAPKYFMSKLQNKCLQKQPGCIYDDLDKCSNCLAPFKPALRQNKCYITGCLEHNLDGCRQCKYPFEMNDNKTCVIKNCLKTDDDKCTECFGGYILENGLCTTGDPSCAEYDFKTGQCLRCKQGYRVVNNRCQYEDMHCQSFSSKGHCQNCQRLYFLNPLKQCEIKDPNCQQYVNGYCTKCKPNFYYFNSLCVQNSKGCAVQTSIDKCEKCQSGYLLDNTSKCVQTINRLNWNSIDMDFFSSTDTTTKKELEQVFTPGKLNKVNLQPCLKSNHGELFYSSDIENIKSVHIEADGKGWQPKNELNEYIGVQIQKMEVFYAIDIKCMANNKMTSFMVEYLDSNMSATFKKGNTFDLVCEAPGVVKTFYITPVEAYAIRIRVKKGLPNIKIEFYYNNQAYKPIEILKNDTIIQKTIQATVESFNQALINNCKDKELCWFGLEICEPRNVTGLTIQYDQGSKGKISSIYVEYSVDGIQFQCYNQCRPINVNDGIVKFNKTLFGSKVRVHISGYEGEPNIRVKFDYN